jgi:biotin transport system substrate-specific component
MIIATTPTQVLNLGLRLILSVALLTLSAKITIPFWPVPMTMQVGVLFLIAGLGGLRFGTLSISAYLAAGAIGLPVFAGTPIKGIGLAYMAGPTGGYLLGFLLAAIIIGWAADRFGPKSQILAMPVALFVIYASGTAWLAQFVPFDKLLAFGVTPFLAGDIIKLALAFLLTLIAPASVVRAVRGTTDA